MEIQTCALCLQKKELRNSHIIPKFISDWFISTSPTGYLREAGNPNLRMQDGERKKLLCHNCEQLFSKWENKFAQIIFHPYIKSNSGIEFTYEEWLEKFIVSVAWRYGVTNPETIKEAPISIQNLFNSTIKKWREYLLRDAEITSGQHIFFLSTLESAQQDISIHPRFNTYILRSMGVNFIYNKNTNDLCVYIKFPSLLLLSFIQPKYPKGWKDTRIYKQGLMKTPQQVADDTGVFLFLQRDAKYMFEATNRLSEPQKLKITDTVGNIKNRLTSVDMSSSLEAWTADMKLKEILSGRKIGRNDLCYCGSGKKFKKCHYLSE